MEHLRWVFRYNTWTPTKEQWMSAAKQIQETERERIARFAYQADAKASMSGRLMMRKAARLLTGLSNPHIFFSRSEFGRPILCASPISVDFNVSHQGGLTVLAAGPSCQAGVDVMRVELARGSRNATEFFRLMGRNFNEEEWACIRSGEDDAEQMRLFYRHWCLKESYVKAVGRGIGYELRRLHCHLNGLSARGPFISAPEQVVEEWQFEEHDIGSEHVAAISWNSNKPIPPGNFVELDVDDLFSEEPIVSWMDDSYWTNFAAKEEHASLNRHR